MNCPCCNQDTLEKKRVWPVLGGHVLESIKYAKDYILCTTCGLKAKIIYPKPTK